MVKKELIYKGHPVGGPPGHEYVEGTEQGQTGSWLYRNKNEIEPGKGKQGKGQGNAYAWGLRNQNREGVGREEEYFWNEENRLMEAEINGKSTCFLYDASGERTIKRGENGETLYVDKFYQVQNRSVVTRHIFVGETRIVSRLSHHGYVDSEYEKGNVYYYHPDHIGSTTYVTDSDGEEYEHLEYTPYGETWIEEGTNLHIIGYKFTSKELDTETGLYYFGARYLDPQTSRWISPDPLLEKYLLTTDKEKNNNLPGEKDKNLPGRGGVFNPHNLGNYHYSHQNPLKYFDPDGKVTTVIIVKDKIGGVWVGTHSALIVDNPLGEIESKPVLYDPAGRQYDPRDIYGDPLRGITGDVLYGEAADLDKYKAAYEEPGTKIELYQFETTPEQEREIAERIEEQGEGAGGFCSFNVISAIKGIGPFKKLRSIVRPGRLANVLQRIQNNLLEEQSNVIENQSNFVDDLIE
ncbi:hypothetical protein ES703_24155 [subsurface metagenome]